MAISLGNIGNIPYFQTNPPGEHLRRLQFCKPVSVVQSVENLGEILEPQRNSELRFDQNLSKLLCLKMAIPLDFCCFSYKHMFDCLTLKSLNSLESLVSQPPKRLNSMEQQFTHGIERILHHFPMIFPCFSIISWPRRCFFRFAPRLVIS